MRKQLVKTTEKLLNENNNIVLLLGDIGVYGFKEAFKIFPGRVYNIGILEQATIGVAAGMSMQGLIPIIHTIAPFLVERCYEQLKVDFCYHQLGGNFISVGGSYDYSSLGPTHHCPGDVGILKYLPGMEILVPGTSQEFDSLFKECYNNNKPTYIRLSEFENDLSFDTKLGKGVIIKKGTSATVIAIGPTLTKTLNAVSDLDVTLLYYTSVNPFDVELIKNHNNKGKIFIVEPYYRGSLLNEIVEIFKPNHLKIGGIGVPIKFLNNYGLKNDHDIALGFTEKYIYDRIKDFIIE
jgi:transketolase